MHSARFFYATITKMTSVFFFLCVYKQLNTKQQIFLVHCVVASLSVQEFRAIFIAMYECVETIHNITFAMW